VGVGAILTLLLFAAEAPNAQSNERQKVQEHPPVGMEVVTWDANDAELAKYADEMFQQGCELRKKGESGEKEFQDAVTAYRELQRRGVANPVFYRNFGHACVLAEDLPLAILAFHQGLRIAPYDADLQNSLTEARALVVYPVDNPLGRPAVEKQVSFPPYAVPGLLIAAFILYCGLCVSVTRWWMTRRGWLLLVAALCLMAASLPTALLTLLYVDAERRHHAETERALVVIKADGVLLRKGDGMTYPARYDTPLNRGVEARRVHERPGWVQIELAGGEIGWVPRQFVLIDGPDPVPAE
jgi:hypothetical protein